MKHAFFLVLLTFFAALHCEAQISKVKKLLVVTTTAGFRHDIDTVERSLSEIAKESGKFELEFLRQPPGRPAEPKKVAALRPDANEQQRIAFEAATAKYKEEFAAFQSADTIWRKTILAKTLEKLSPGSLAGYDGVIFASTTGELPLPDKAGFLNWIKSGKAFIGFHAATDTLMQWPEYVEMIGGSFKTHGDQVGVDIINAAPKHRSTKHLPSIWKIDLEEIYQFNNYDPKRVHELLILDHHPNNKTPGHFPLAWTREYGKGRVFYTAIGHRADIWDPNPNLKDRKNPPATAAAFRQHALAGILWALGIK
ncbi:MAG: ThuA domain-containing protein [Pyrinomonadaceae bacterium]